MNLFLAELKEEDGRMSLRFGGQRLPVPEGCVGLAERSAGKVLIGLRPEHIRILEGGTKEREGSVAGVVDLVEPMGRESLLHARIEDFTIQVLTSEGAFQRGESVALAPEWGSMHLFPI